MPIFPCNVHLTPINSGLIRVEENGAAIEVAVWQMPVENLGSFLAGIAQPLG